ncbi:6,7-dimethyl-8-ribityllumazine synthase [Marilutibacter alkalisoli]|uniref:6,7-dimethyl-8-ribityllumazine synthase n=1 Tax=Marilutibacter alkalisoli TaxID=2591633 RepID=A0A514BUC6_9GAMM|nr:6,7-dimethyl-8-ribityllumazine synthase [Lysobacter alkalisoli]QDH70972.1 6,7-dimethyl-8-ribityllumazine synthase [Lysobacter alkalisoli]
MPHIEGDLRSPPGARYAIIASRWNPRITDTLVAGARKTFTGNGVVETAIDVIRVPGAWEIPVTAARLAEAGDHAAIVALGCVVRGDTRHYEQVADGVSDALMRVSLDFGVPVANGVLAVDRFEDAEARAGGNLGNKGEEAALVAIEMAHLLSQLPEPDDLDTFMDTLVEGDLLEGRP